MEVFICTITEVEKIPDVEKYFVHYGSNIATNITSMFEPRIGDRLTIVSTPTEHMTLLNGLVVQVSAGFHVRDYDEEERQFQQALRKSKSLPKELEKKM